MVDRRMHHPVGRHLLGPHVVGQRVVVRRVVRGETGPSGGPALTDLLGTCLAFGDGVVVVAPESGDPVTIPLADVVSGKPVPPRASVRTRVPARDAQVAGFALFPGLRTAPLGDWVLRSSATHDARRANSVLAFGDSGLGQAESVAAVVAHYDTLAQRPIAAVLAGSPEAELFEAAGWGPESRDADTLFQLTSIAQAARALRGALPRGAPGAELVEDGDEGLVTAAVPGRDGVQASCVAALRDDWVGFRSLAVAPPYRRRGLGLVLMDALVGWAAERGAHTAYLQVIADNEPALALYGRLGFRTHHRYRYLAAPPG